MNPFIEVFLIMLGILILVTIGGILFMFLIAWLNALFPNKSIHVNSKAAYHSSCGPHDELLRELQQHKMIDQRNRWDRLAKDVGTIE